MHILASDFFEKDDKYYLRLEIRVAVKEFLVFKIYFASNLVWLGKPLPNTNVF